MSLEVSVGALRNAASDWRHASTSMGVKATAWGGHISHGGLSLGIYYPLGDAYDAACQALVTVAGQAATNLHAVCDTLEATANTYEELEAQQAALAQDTTIDLSGSTAKDAPRRNR